MTVGRVKNEFNLTSTCCSEKTYINKHGQESTMNTENIGKKPVINQPTTQSKLEEPTTVKLINAEERHFAKNGEIFNAKRFAVMATSQIDRIEKSDPTSFESLNYVLEYVKDKLKKW